MYTVLSLRPKLVKLEENCSSRQSAKCLPRRFSALLSNSGEKQKFGRRWGLCPKCLSSTSGHFQSMSSILNKTRHAASNTNKESLVTWWNKFSFACGSLNLLDCSLLGSLVARLLSILGSSGDYLGLIDQTQQLNGGVVDVIVGRYHAQVEGDSVHVILNADTIAVLQPSLDKWSDKCLWAKPCRL